MAELDPRIVRVGIEVGGQLQTYDDLAIFAKGSKYANANQNEVEIRITNLARTTRDFLLTETSPFNKSKVRKRIILEVGRVSYGYSTCFMGDIVSSVGSQPPDIILILKCATGNFSKSDIVQRSAPGVASLRGIAGQTAADLGLSLNFEAADKQIGNYSFTGGALRQVDKLGESGGVNAYVDDGTLVVKPKGQPLAGSTRVLNIDTGMIGIPEFTERGIKVKMLYDNQTKLGTGLDVRSLMNPAANGLYDVYKLDFEIANRDTPFYLIAEASRVDGATAAKVKKR